MKYLKSVFVIVLLLSIFILQGFAQQKLKVMPASINSPSTNIFSPYISGDGQTIVYLSDYTDDGHHAMYWSTKKSAAQWNDGVLVNRLINRPTLNYHGGYSLSFDGDQLFYSTNKAGIGGFDIWSSKRNGNDWEAPRNFGKPLNTNSNEGSPSLSPDGEYLYYMQCEKMQAYGGASGCQLMRSKKTNRGWSTGKPLPSNINTGNSQNPRLLADGETFIFASDQMGGQGGLDLFLSKKIGDNTYTDPVALDFANTSDDDAFISIPAKGRYMYKAVKDDRNSQIVQILIPDEYQPKDVMRIQGEVTNQSGSPLNGTLTIFNIDDRDRLWNEKTGNAGEFAIVLKEGAKYDLSVSAEDASLMYYAKVYDLEKIGSRDKQKLNIILNPLTVGEEYPLAIQFKEFDSEIDDISIYEMRRLGDFLRKNSALTVEILVSQNHYLEDSVRSNPDLTESRLDTITFDQPHIDTSLMSSDYDSLFSYLGSNLLKEQEVIIDSTIYMISHNEDSLFVAHSKITNPNLVDVDTLEDNSIALASPPEKIDTVKVSFPLIKFKIQEIYHNDRTSGQSENIKGFLLERGVKPDQIEITGMRRSDPAYEENESSVVVKMKVLKL